ncbi:MAG TPA: hypothetical protein VGB73_04165 [Pyrinomonadaceae bacterium]|jgi:hypothetical protein
MNDTRGSLWRKWDLHVHTPESFVHNYNGEKEKAWARFLDDLEALPPEFKVLGINDYIFVEGYKRVLAAKQAGRLGNLDLILPVVELRLDKFGGSESQLSRVNLHVIFSEQIRPEVIEQQFLNALPRNYQIAPEYEHLKSEWYAVATRESLAELGRLINENSPADVVRQNRGVKLEALGFNNINFSFKDVMEVLKHHPFKGKYITAVGKNEWTKIKWTQSTAEKKNIINKVDMVFTCAKSVEEYADGKRKLSDAGVNSKLLDCSDAHQFSDSAEHARIGKCFTWIKADATFEGLRQALREPDERIFVGAVPEKIHAVEGNKTKYIKSLRVHRKEGSRLDEVWFDADLEFNHGLVTIIGNKGMAKSALTDILGLVGGTKNYKHFSFLNPEKFMDSGNNKAQHFEATLTWESGHSVTRQLDAGVQPAEVEAVKYIPQHFFESVCNEVASYRHGATSGGREGSFDRELKEVIFSHVEEADRLGKRSLDELISYKTSEIDEAIRMLRDELHEINKDIAALEERLTAEYREMIEAQLTSRKAALDAHLGSKPDPVPTPDSDDHRRQNAAAAADIQVKKDEVKRLEGLIAEAADRKNKVTQAAAAVNKALGKIKNFQRQYANFKNDCAAELSQIGVDFDSLARLEVNEKPLFDKHDELTSEQQSIEDFLDHDSPDSPVYKKVLLEIEIGKIQETLDEAGKAHQSYLRALERWGKKEKEIIGGSESPGSIKYFENILKKLDEAPAELIEAKGRRAGVARRIYAHVNKLAQIYRELYRPVQSFILGHPLAKDKFTLNFDVMIVNRMFKERFFEWVSHGVAGTFCGTAPGKRALEDLLQRHDFNDEESTMAFLESLTVLLLNDARTGNAMRVEEQLKKGKTAESLYDFLFSLEYLSPQYVLKMGDKELHQLSPGEKGTLLLIFYLLVDKGDVPLIIDQPEENLDNQTVVDLLVPAVKKARRQRQIFIVTHNPNIAVVCDSDQVISCRLDKKNLNRVEYVAGSIENPVINKRIIDILEGTWPAFDNRKSKYLHQGS